MTWPRWCGRFRKVRVIRVEQQIRGDRVIAKLTARLAEEQQRVAILEDQLEQREEHIEQLTKLIGEKTAQQPPNLGVTGPEEPETGRVEADQ